MRILPAIDLKDGRCVRLQKGDFGTATQVAADPVETARSFVAAGATLVHMVDLDAAKTGAKTNYPIVRAVIEQAGAMVELGGGVRTMADVEALVDLGVRRVIIGSAAVSSPDLVAAAVGRFGDRIAVGIDALGDTVRTAGWLQDSGISYLELARRMEALGVATLIYTDIDHDGMEAGPSFARLEQLRAAVVCCLVASGGVTTPQDAKKLAAMGIEEAIVGKAVYSGQFPLSAIQTLEQL